MRQGFDLNEPAPKWDVALEALVREECAIKGEALRLADFLRLAKAHAIRFDDIMDTVFRLVIHGAWRYEDEAHVARAITQDEMNRLYVNGRLREEDMKPYSGYWRPQLS